jgi:cytochrome c-type biogenesis protein CcmH/NrfG
MGLISGLLTWPLAPVRGVVWVAEQIRAEAEAQWSDPAVVQRQLDEVERMLDEGLIDEAEAEEREEELLQCLFERSSASTGIPVYGDMGYD